MDDDMQDELKLRRRRLIEASKTPRTKEEINEVLKPYKSKGFSWIVDDRECTITREFVAYTTDPSNNKIQRARDVILAVSGNLRRPIEDFVFDVKMLLASAGAIQEAQRTLTRRSA
jgi:hypothetical protein